MKPVVVGHNDRPSVNVMRGGDVQSCDTAFTVKNVISSCVYVALTVEMRGNSTLWLNCAQKRGENWCRTVPLKLAPPRPPIAAIVPSTTTWVLSLTGVSNECFIITWPTSRRCARASGEWSTRCGLSKAERGRKTPRASRVRLMSPCVLALLMYDGSTRIFSSTRSSVHGPTHPAS